MYDENFEEFEEEFGVFGDFDEFFDEFDEEQDYGYVYFPDATKIFDYDELKLKSNTKYKILGYVEGMPIIELSKGRILELMENEIGFIEIVPPGAKKNDDIHNPKYIKYIKVVEELWLENAIDLSLKYRDEKAFKKLMLIKYPKNN